MLDYKLVSKRILEFLITENSYTLCVHLCTSVYIWGFHLFLSCFSEVKVLSKEIWLLWHRVLFGEKKRELPFSRFTVPGLKEY